MNDPQARPKGDLRSVVAEPSPVPEEMQPLLELRGVHRRFGPCEIIRGVDLKVRRGERVALIGPNGAGKSTLFNLISGQLAPSAGDIVLRGRSIAGMPPHRISRLGLARSFQVSSLFGQLTVFDNLRCAAMWRLGHGHTFWRRLSALGDVRERADALIELLHLGARRDVLAAHLSYAEQRTLEVGITLAGGAELLLLDEPTAGMSRSETDRFLGLVRTVTQDRTVLMVEHDMGVVFGLADRVAVLVHGQIIAFDTPDRVRADARVQAAYLGAMQAGHQAGASEVQTRGAAVSPGPRDTRP
jgi:branched-chain amino acid transport system ATP-binding protein